MCVGVFGGPGRLGKVGGDWLFFYDCVGMYARACMNLVGTTVYVLFKCIPKNSFMFFMGVVVQASTALQKVMSTVSKAKIIHC